MTFEEAYQAMPICIAINVDPLAHKTVDDLRYIAEDELQLHAEGQDGYYLHPSQVRAIRRFLTKITA